MCELRPDDVMLFGFMGVFLVLAAIAIGFILRKDQPAAAVLVSLSSSIGRLEEVTKTLTSKQEKWEKDLNAAALSLRREITKVEDMAVDIGSRLKHEEEHR